MSGQTTAVPITSVVTITSRNHRLKELARLMVAALGSSFKGTIEINVNTKTDAITMVVRDHMDL